METFEVTWKLYIWMFSLFFKVDAVVLNVEPQFFEPGMTDRLLINCSVSKKDDPKFAFLNSMILKRRDEGQENFVEQASINTVTKEVVVYNEASGYDPESSGELNAKGDSYLSLQWVYPTHRMAGYYKCEAHGMSLEWKPLTTSDIKNVSSKSIPYASVIDQLRNVKVDLIKKTQEISDLQVSVKNTIQTSKEFIDSLTSRIEMSKNWFFKVSTLFKGRRYYLSQQDPTMRSEEAMATCVFYGGYLAEINDMEEYAFVLAFFKQFSGFNVLLLGGTDEGRRGQWLYRHSNTTVPDWLMKLRKNNPDYRCLYLYAGIDWYALDTYCYHPSPPYEATRYLCEIPL